MAQETTSLIMDLTGWKLLNNNKWEEVLPPYLWTGVERWMLKSDRLVCEKNAAKAQPVTNCNLGSINYVYFNYKVNLLIDREKIFVTILKMEIGWIGYFTVAVEINLVEGCGVGG